MICAHSAQDIIDPSLFPYDCSDIRAAPRGETNVMSARLQMICHVQGRLLKLLHSSDELSLPWLS